jgi:hypothetical protein
VQKILPLAATRDFTKKKVRDFAKRWQKQCSELMALSPACDTHEKYKPYTAWEPQKYISALP